MYIYICTDVHRCQCGHYMFLFSPYTYILEALYEKKQAISTCELENSRLQAQVNYLEAISAEKDTLNAKYEAMVKESEGQMI